MRSRPFDPRRLDVEAFAKEGGELQGEWPLTALDRLMDAAHPQALPTAGHVAHWQARGITQPVRGAPTQTWLEIEADTHLSLVCQRCLGPVDTAIAAQRRFLFASDENTAEQLDADSEDDVLAMTRALDLRTLVEDELLLGLPLVPRHDVCPEPLPLLHDDEPAEEQPHPFAALAALKRRGPAR
jgi:uncharacterized protein